LEEPDVERCVSVPRPSLAEGYIAIINERFPTFQEVQRFNIYQRLLAIEMEDDMQATNELLNLNRRRP
jgi:hypothetical protein